VLAGRQAAPLADHEREVHLQLVGAEAAEFSYGAAQLLDTPSGFARV
jgi:hypothetical protein